MESPSRSFLSSKSLDTPSSSAPKSPSRSRFVNRSSGDSFSSSVSYRTNNTITNVTSPTRKGGNVSGHFAMFHRLSNYNRLTLQLAATRIVGALTQILKLHMARQLWRWWKVTQRHRMDETCEAYKIAITKRCDRPKAQFILNLHEKQKKRRQLRRSFYRMYITGIFDYFTMTMKVPSMRRVVIMDAQSRYCEAQELMMSIDQNSDDITDYMESDEFIHYLHNSAQHFHRFNPFYPKLQICFRNIHNSRNMILRHLTSLRFHKWRNIVLEMRAHADHADLIRQLVQNETVVSRVLDAIERDVLNEMKRLVPHFDIKSQGAKAEITRASRSQGHNNDSLIEGPNKGGGRVYGDQGVDEVFGICRVDSDTNRVMWRNLAISGDAIDETTHEKMVDLLKRQAFQTMRLRETMKVLPLHELTDPVLAEDILIEQDCANNKNLHSAVWTIPNDIVSTSSSFSASSLYDNSTLLTSRTYETNDPLTQVDYGITLG